MVMVAASLNKSPVDLRLLSRARLTSEYVVAWFRPTRPPP